VAKERLKSPRARLFVALDLPEAVRDGLARWQREAMTGQEALRPAHPEALHVTLCFLGYQAEKDVGRISEIVRAVQPRGVRVRFEPQPVPIPRNRPRLFAVAAPSEGAVELQADLARRLENSRFYKREKRPFWSHVTVAHVKPQKAPHGSSKGRRHARPRRIERAPKPLPNELLEPFDAVRVRLYRSTLRPSGAEYAPLADLTLPPTEAEKR
jgi:2'-5' RNA ligase